MEKKILNIGLNQEYSDAYSIICRHRSNALMAVNVEHLLMCWELGGYISFRIKQGKWGDGIVQGLVDFVHQQNPSMKGFSKRNLYNMVRFYDSFSSALFLQESTKYQLDVFVQPPAAQIGNGSYNPIMQPLAAQIAEMENITQIRFIVLSPSITVHGGYRVKGRCFSSKRFRTIRVLHGSSGSRCQTC